MEILKLKNNNRLGTNLRVDLRAKGESEKENKSQGALVGPYYVFY